VLQQRMLWASNYVGPVVVDGHRVSIQTAVLNPLSEGMGESQQRGARTNFCARVLLRKLD